MGNWDPDSAVPLSPDNYPLRHAQVELPVATTIEYKYIRLDEAGNVTWGSDPNRVFTTPSPDNGKRPISGNYTLLTLSVNSLEYSGSFNVATKPVP